MSQLDYDVGYRDGESDVVADLDELLDELGIDTGGRHPIEVIRELLK